MIEEYEDERLDLNKAERAAVRKRSMRLLGDMIKPQRGQLAIVSILIILEVGLLTTLPWLASHTINHAVEPAKSGDHQPLLQSIIIYGGAVIIAAISALLNISLTGLIAQKMLYELRIKMFRHAQKLSVSFHEKYTSGRVIARLSSDLETLKAFFEAGLSDFVASGLSVLFAVVVLFIMDWRVGLLFLVVLVPVFLISRWWRKLSTLAFRDFRTYNARMITEFNEVFGGIRAVKAFGYEKQARSDYGKISEQYRLKFGHGIRLFGVFWPSTDGLGKVFVALVLVVGGYSALGGTMGAATLLALVLYANRVFEPLLGFTMFYNQFQAAGSALEKLSTFLVQEPDVPEPKNPAIRKASAKGEIEFRGAYFEYQPGKTALYPFDLKIPAGQRVALVGTTGAGKSTLAKLVARFYDLSDGSLQIDGLDVRDLSDEQLRRDVTMITQEAYLFSGTVADNIRLGDPDASFDRVQDAAKRAGVHDFIMSLPEGYETDLTGRGGTVSAGQRQLLSFARTFLADPAILILDESTAALDIPSERKVQKALEALFVQRTAIVIAHRLSTIIGSDRVLVVDAGRIVEDGTPQELIASGGRFAALYAQWQKSMGESAED
ncbi:MAG: ABC transporter ATP-binding protein [Microbacteriaceae bacterium]|nr:ABC transporter ATP-binding protein [Microbacteriaceae bacterium]